MAENKSSNTRKNPAVQSGKEAGTKKKPESTKKTPDKKGKSFEENIIRDSETAKERGRNGGIKSVESRRAKKNAQETVRYLLDRMTKSQKIRENLDELGCEKTEFTNLLALHGRLFSMAMSGNLDAYKELMKMAGYEPEENRKERESISADARREQELTAKIEALGQKREGSSVSVSLNDEDDNNDVVVYMPQQLSEEECTVVDEDETETTNSE